MERRLAEIPTEEWGDVQVDITPREYVLDYLAHSLPDAALRALHRRARAISPRGRSIARRPAGAMPRSRRAPRPHDRASGVACRRCRARSTRSCSASAPTWSPRSPAARAASSASGDRLCVENRAGSANLAETSAFMDDDKRILVFSDAGGTGRSYHADLGARNQRLRIHYLLEPGWKADAAIQGLGRTQPHQPGTAAAVPADRDRRQGREALPVDDRAPARHARRHHQGPAPDRRPGPVPGRGQSRKPLCPRRAAAALSADPCRQGRGLLALRRSRRRPGSISCDEDGILREELPPITHIPQPRCWR